MRFLIVLPNEKLNIFNKKCGCERIIKSDDFGNEFTLFNQTTCSQDAYLRGKHQKIVSFSYFTPKDAEFGKKKGFYVGIKGNLQKMEQFYPGWIMRLYHNMDQNDPMLKDVCNLVCQNSNFDICDVKDLPGNPFTDGSKIFPTIWRFFPTLDPQVMKLSRDSIGSSLGPVGTSRGLVGVQLGSNLSPYGVHIWFIRGLVRVRSGSSHTVCKT